jgi:hypothetical protein
MLLTDKALDGVSGFLADGWLLWKARNDPGCVKTFWSRFYSQVWDENRVPTQFSGLLINQTLADFT